MARQSHEPSSLSIRTIRLCAPRGYSQAGAGVLPENRSACAGERRSHFPSQIYESLALKYRMALEELEACTGETYPVIRIMGGGVRIVCSVS